MATILYNRVYPKGTAVKNITVGPTEVKYAKRGDGKLFYDTLNYYSYIVPVIISFSYSTNTVVAGGGTTSKPTYSYSQQKIPVGYSGDSYAASTLTSGATISFKVSGTGATIDPSTGVVTWASRGTDHSTTLRSATVTMTVTINGVSATKTTTVYLNANTVSIKSVTVNAGSLTAPTIYLAKGETKQVSNNASATASAILLFASGDEIAATTDYGNWTGPNYEWSSNKDYAVVSGTAASANVEMKSRGSSLDANLRTATITRNATFTFTLKSPYGSSSKSNDKSCSVTVTLDVNTISYGNWMGTLSLNSTTALSAGTDSRTLTFGKVYRIATYSSGETFNDYYQGTIYLTASVNSGSSYVSSSVTQAANSTSTSSSTISKSSYGTTIINSQTYTIYLRIGSTTGSIIKQISISTTANRVTQVTSYITSFSYSGNISAAGGTATVSLSSSCTLKFTSGSSASGQTASGGYTGGTITTTMVYSALTTAGASVDASTGAVTWDNRGTTIGNSRSITVTATRVYTFKHDSTYGGGSVTGSTATATATSTQNGNYVTSLSVSGKKLSYANIAAGATSASPTHTPGTLTYNFSSGKSTTTAPSSTYGTLTSVTTYTLASSTNGFTSVDKDTGVLTATSRGIDYNASTRSSATVTVSTKYTWTPTTSYNSAGTKTTTPTATATCTQNANLITKLEFVSVNGGSITTPSTVPASGNSALSLTSSVAASTGCKMTFSSGATSNSYSDYVNIGISYSWSETSDSSGMATFTDGKAASQTVNIASRGSSYDESTRSCTYKRIATITASLKSGYTNATSISTTASASVTVTQAKNVITTVTVSVGAGAITHNAGTVAAAGATVSVTSSTNGSYSGKLKFSSGSEVDASSTYGSWSTAYSWSESDSAGMLSFTSANTATMSVTVASRSTTVATTTRSATITRNFKATFTLNGTYDGGTTSGTNNANTAALTITQAKNLITAINSVTVNAGAISYNSGNTIAASGLGSTNTVNVTSPSVSASLKLSSGSNITANSTYGSFGGPTYSWSETDANNMLSFTSANASVIAVTTASRSTSYGAGNITATLKRTASYSYTVSATYSSTGAAISLSNSATASTTVTLAPNIITKLEVINASGGSITTPSNVGAGGNNSLSLSSATAASAGCRVTFSSGATTTSYSTYVSLSTAYSWSETSDAEGMATFTNSGAASQTIKVASRGTTYSTATRSCVYKRTATFTATLKSGYTSAAAATGSASASVTVTLNKNVITGVSVSVSAGAITHSAGTVAAKGATVSVTSSTNGSYSATLTFSSGSTTAASSTYGSWTSSYSWSESDSAGMISFTNANSATMSVTVASRGATYGASERSASVTRKYTATFTLNSTYNNGATSGTNNASTSALTIKLAANTFTKVVVGVNAGAITAPGTYPASGSTLTVSNATAASLGTVTLTFASESTTTSYSTYGSISGPSYSWSENLSYSSIAANNGASATVKMDSRGTEHSTSTRSATVTRTATYTFTLSSSYTGFSATLGSKSCTATITQAANTVSIKSVTVSGGKITAPATYAAAGATKSVANNTAATASGVLVFASGSEVAASTTYGTWTGPTYSWSENQSYSSIVTNNGAAADVKMDARGTTTGDARSATVTRTASFTFTLKSPYGTSNKSNTGSCTATITQEANVRTLVSVYLSAYQPHSSWIVTVSSGSWNTCPASGGYLKARGYANYTHTSGSALNDLKITDDASLSWSGSPSWITAHTNGGYRVASRGTSYDVNTRSSTGTWSYTYGGVTKSATKSITQAKNVITLVSVTSTPGSITGVTGVAAAGATVSLTATAASASAILTYSSGGTVTTNYNSTTYGTWTFHGYSGTSGNTAIATIGTVGYSAVSITVLNNTSAAAREVTITRKEAGFTFTLSSSYNNGATSGKSTGTSCSCKVTLLAGVKKYGSWTGGAITFSKTSLGAGADSATVTIKPWSRTWGWNATSGGGTEYYTGTVTVSENGSYTSLSSTSYTASSSNATLTLSKSTCGSTVTSAATITVTANPNTDGPGTTTGTISQVANVESKVIDSTSWVNPVVTINSLLTAAGGSATVSATQSGTRYYHHEYTSGTKDAVNAHNEAVSNTSFTFSISHKSFSTTTTQSTNGNMSRYTISGTKVTHTTMGTNVGYDHLTVSAVGLGKTGTKSTYVQNAITKTEDITVSDAWNPPVPSIGSGISAAGGLASLTATLSGTRTYYTKTTYTSGSTSNSANKTKSISNTSFTWSEVSDNNSRFSVSGSTLSHSTMGLNVTTDTVKVRCTGAGSKTADVSKSVTNSETEVIDSTTWNDITITFGSGLTAGASSFTVSATLSGTLKYHHTYTSGQNDAVGAHSRTVNNSSFTYSISHQSFSSSTTLSTNGNMSRYTISGAKVSHSSMTTNVGYDHITVKVAGAGSKSNTKSTYVLNIRTKNTGSMKSYGKPVVTIGSGMTAAGGLATVTVTVTNERYWYYTWSSGSAESTTAHSENVAGSYTSLKISSNGNSRFSLSGTTVSHSSMLKNVTTDTVKISAANAASTSVVGEGSKSITNSKTYSNVRITRFAYSPNPLAGSAGATSSPAITVTATTTWTSGSTESGTVTGYTTTFVLAKGSAFTVSSTGVVTTKGINNSGSSGGIYSDTVSLTVNVGGATASSTCSISQKTNSYYINITCQHYTNHSYDLILSTTPTPNYYNIPSSATRYKISGYLTISIPTGASINVVNGFSGMDQLTYATEVYVVQVWATSYNEGHTGALTMFWWEPNKNYDLSVLLAYTGMPY